MKKTFIKMQSLSRKAWLCGGLIAMAAALVGCSSDAPDPGDNNPNPGVAQTDGDPLTVISDQATLSGMVLNFAGNPSDISTAYTLPDPNKLDYSAAEDIKTAAGTYGKIQEDKQIKITDGGEYKVNLDASGKNVEIFIVKGTFNGDIKNGGNVTVHILKDGLWNATGSDALSTPNLKIYDYDNGLVCPKGEVTMQCSYYGKEFKQSGTTFTLVNENADLFVEGEIEVTGLISVCKAQISAKCLKADRVDITEGSKCYLGAYMEATNLWLQNGGRIYLNKRAYVKVKNNLDCVDSYSGFDSPDEAVIYAKKYYFGAGINNVPGIDNVSGQFRGAIDVYAGGIYDATSELGSNKQYRVSEIPVQGDNIHIYSAEDGAFNNFKEPMTGCPSGDNPVNPNPGPDVFPDMPVVIAKIVGDHTHEISATGIDVSNNKAYVSWHERGGSIHGCIETIEIDGSEAKITNWMETPRWEYVAAGDPTGANAETAYDFNHVIYDQDANAVIVVGEHAKKGGIIGRVLLNRTSGQTSELGVFENRKLGVEEYEGNTNTGLIAGGSGNCVVISPKSSDGKKYLLVASRGGYQKIPYGDIQSVNDPFAVGEGLKHLITSKMMKAISTNGSGKHLALYDNSLVSIEYTAQSPDKPYWWEDTETALEAKISLWENWEDFLEKEPKTINVPAFSPVFGKDVIAMDDQYIYSCQGHRGVAIYEKSSGSEKARFNVDRYIREHRNYFTRDQIIRMTGAAANGLAEYGKYLYIAYGSAGLWVLDKTNNFEPVGFYVTAGTYPGNDSKKASANYVKVMEDGKIFVAYGRDGVKVLEMGSTLKARQGK